MYADIAHYNNCEKISQTQSIIENSYNTVHCTVIPYTLRNANKWNNRHRLPPRQLKYDAARVHTSFWGHMPTPWLTKFTRILANISPLIAHIRTEKNVFRPKSFGLVEIADMWSICVIYRNESWHRNIINYKGEFVEGKIRYA